MALDLALLAFLSCLVVSCRVVSCRVVSCRVVSCHVVSCRVLSSLVFSCLVLSCVVYPLEAAVAAVPIDVARIVGILRYAERVVLALSYPGSG